jgi:hypothetical protein
VRAGGPRVNAPEIDARVNRFERDLRAVIRQKNNLSEDSQLLLQKVCAEAVTALSATGEDPQADESNR